MTCLPSGERFAEQSKAPIEALFKKPVLTQIVEGSTLYRLEEYHQDFYKKYPIRYQVYRLGCGLNRRLQEIRGNAKSK